MNFADALMAMAQGERVRLPWWRGYWYMRDNTIFIHTRDGRDFDIRESDDIIKTLSYTTSDSWQFVPDRSVLNDLQQEMNELCKN